MRALAQMGDSTDLPKLREIARNETEKFAAFCFFVALLMLFLSPLSRRSGLASA